MLFLNIFFVYLLVLGTDGKNQKHPQIREKIKNVLETFKHHVGFGLAKNCTNQATNNLVLVSNDRFDQNKFLLPGGKVLYREDILSLNEYGWLTDHVLDYVIQEIVDKDKLLVNGPFNYIDAVTASYTIKNPGAVDQMHIWVGMSLKEKIIISPFNCEDDHWCVIIGNTIDGIIEFYDPYDPNQFVNVLNRMIPNSAKEYIKLFKMALNNRDAFVSLTERLYPDNWKIKTLCSVNISKQKEDDENDCGIYVIRYIDLYLNKNPTLPAKGTREFIKRKISELLNS